MRGRTYRDRAILCKKAPGLLRTGVLLRSASIGVKRVPPALSTAIRPVQILIHLFYRMPISKSLRHFPINTCVPGKLSRDTRILFQLFIISACLQAIRSLSFLSTFFLTFYNSLFRQVRANRLCSTLCLLPSRFLCIMQKS